MQSEKPETIMNDQEKDAFNGSPNDSKVNDKTVNEQGEQSCTKVNENSSVKNGDTTEKLSQTPVAADANQKETSDASEQEKSNAPNVTNASADSHPVAKDKPEQTHNSVSMMHSLRRSERIRNQAARAEEQRLIREERAAIEEAKARARSIAAKKAAATKRKAASEAEKAAAESAKARKTGANTTPSSSLSTGSQRTEVVRGAPKKIVKLKYLNLRPLPQFSPINLGDTPLSLFWLRLNIREFLFRFDKLCRLPLRSGTAINDPLQPYTPEQLKNVALSLLKLISNDTTPLHARVRDYIAEIDNLDATNPNIWDWLLQFVEQLDAYAPQEVPTTEEEQSESLRRLMVICTGTETIRITVTSDVDQLKWVEKDSQEEIKGIQAKFKETEAKLAKLKSVDKEVWSQKLAAARRSADNKIWKSHQQLYTKLHKYNMRSAPSFTDPAGNKYWSFQYKSASSSDWGSWIICEIIKRPTDISNWYKELAIDVSRVLNGRDALIAEKNNERKQKRVEAKRSVMPADSTPATEGSKPTGNEDQSAGNASTVLNGSTSVKNETTSAVKAETQTTPVASSVEQKPKRKYPKVKIHPLQSRKDVELYYVEGKENIMELAHWLAGFPGVDAKTVVDIENVANYLAQDI